MVRRVGLGLLSILSAGYGRAGLRVMVGHSPRMARHAVIDRLLAGLTSIFFFYMGQWDIGYAWAITHRIFGDVIIKGGRANVSSDFNAERHGPETDGRDFLFSVLPSTSRSHRGAMARFILLSIRPFQQYSLDGRSITATRKECFLAPSRCASRLRQT